ncbi:DUF6387 family protein [Oceanisphaera pacifica]|uniref:Uncharacterized protein n=1 Tax=Oceanisphaera pacifica TaxID=2818389 RepID=A0ABS3NCC5_9GAMM|nr:DUF6387 family protein [Oceanisphaera pacifica]MBO1518248.1 hypothetical protein [Oceanisphaera pacifica]
MAKRINKPEQLPEWFKLERYDVLLELPVAEFIDQLIERISLFEMPFHGINDDGQLKVAFSPLLDTGLHAVNNAPQHARQMEGKESIRPITYSRLAYMDKRARGAGAYGALADRGRTLTVIDDLDAVINFDTFDHAIPMDEGLAVAVNLAEFTDEKILTDIAQLLPFWRESLKHPEPKLEKDKAGIANLTKIIIYRAIPMLDLMFWEQMREVWITNDLLAATLHPDFTVSGAQVGATRKPFIKELMEANFLDRMMLALDKEPHLYGWPVSDFLKR